jgi:hypothetical protein
MSLAPGVRLGPYEILATIGAGGMGEVDKSATPAWTGIVAIKISAAQFTERFGREAAPWLNRPHICALYDVGPDDFPRRRKRPVLASRIVNPGRHPMHLESHQLVRRWEHLRVREPAAPAPAVGLTG